MTYEIQNKNNVQTGATLVVRIPEGELDQKALRTILVDKPDFVLPFRYRVMDGQVEFTYQIGNRSKLSYLSGSRLPAEYAELWIGVLQPLLDCGDWFMTPYSFVLESDYLYCDKASKEISYVYIPSIRVCSDDDALKRMVMDIARQNHVTDMTLENKVVWAIQDFSPLAFLQLVQPYRAQMQGGFAPAEEAGNIPVQETPQKPGKSLPAKRGMLPEPVSKNAPSSDDDIDIIFPADKPQKNAKPKGGGLFGFSKNKEEKPEPKEKSGLRGVKKPQPLDGVQAAAVMSPNAEMYFMQSNGGGYNLGDDVTMLVGVESDGAKLRYTGIGNHPRVIDVDAANGVFTIGRFDVSVGKKQSSFEFDKETKAVSRRHAVIEKTETGHVVVDLASSAGTFVNGQKLHPNTPFTLTRGSRISFGNSGADYIWEE